MLTLNLIAERLPRSRVLITSSLRHCRWPVPGLAGLQKLTRGGVPVRDLIYILSVRRRKKERPLKWLTELSEQ